MIEENNIDTAWLEARYRFDFATRNQDVEKKCLAYFASFPHLNIIDASAGIGSNFLYFFRKLPQDQNWTFYEEDPLRARNAIERIATFFRQQDLEFEYDEYTMSVCYKGRAINVKVILESFKQIEVFSDLENVDWVMANSLFEKDSQDNFAQFTALLKAYKIPFLCTMNYAGMDFLSEEEQDRQYVAIYDKQLKRIPAFGKAMGKDCPVLMRDALEQQNWKVTCGNTHWDISCHDIRMHYYYLNFIEDAVRSYNLDPLELKAFDLWLIDKKNKALSENVQMKIYHQDIFSFF